MMAPGVPSREIARGNEANAQRSRSHGLDIHISTSEEETYSHEQEA
jgi:hypothetical protein